MSTPLKRALWVLGVWLWVALLPGHGSAQEATTEPAPVEEPASPPPPQEPAPEVEERISALERLDIGGYVQAQLRTEDLGSAGSDVVFEVRRGRLKAVYEYEWAKFLLQIDATPEGVELKDATAAFLLPMPAGFELELTMGQFKVPYGYDVQNSSSRRWFPERSQLARRLIPGERDLGVKAELTAFDERLFAQLAAMNGVPLGDAFRSGFPDFEPDRHKDFILRVGTELEGLTVAMTGLWGQGFRPFEDDPMTPEDESEGGVGFDRWSVAGDARWLVEVPVLGELDLHGEVAYGHNLARDRVADYPELVGNDVDSTEQWAWYAAAVQHLGPYVALGIRVQQYLPEAAQDVTLITPVVAFMPVERTRITLAWEANAEDGDDNEGWLRAQVKF